MIRHDVLGDRPGLGDHVDVPISLKLHFQVHRWTARSVLFNLVAPLLPAQALHNTIEPLERMCHSKFTFEQPRVMIYRPDP
jgi:hypothetical protein